MSKFLGMFPLNLAVFPSEKLNLHIFEPRYKQLIKDCMRENSTFGIPVVIEGNTKDYGAELKIIAIEKENPDGEMDIKTEVVGLFKVVDYYEPTPERLYDSAQVEPIPLRFIEDKETKLRLVDLYHEFNRVIDNEKKVIPDVEIDSFSIAGNIGLNIEQKYELMQLENEIDRQLYLVNHLKMIIPLLDEIEQLKHRIKLNGHFRKLSLDDN